MNFFNNFFNNFFDIFKGKNDRNKYSEVNDDLANMEDTNVSLGEDPGTIEKQDDEQYK